MAVTPGYCKGFAVGQCVLGVSAEKGTPFFECYFQITTEGEAKGAMVRWTTYFNPSKAPGSKISSAERSIEALQIMGWEGEDLSEFEDGSLHGADTNEVNLEIELESWTDAESGEERSAPRVKWVNRPGGRLNLDAAMSSEAAQSFGEKMRGLVLAAKARQAPKDSGTDFPHGESAPAPKKKTF